MKENAVFTGLSSHLRRLTALTKPNSLITLRYHELLTVQCTEIIFFVKAVFGLSQRTRLPRQLLAFELLCERAIKSAAELSF
jgi:hypothetical protein